jgi:putative copper resistance protein D
LSTLFDIFGFLSVILHGFDLVAQTVVLGSVLFLLLLAEPLAPTLGPGAEDLLRGTRRIIRVSALAGIVVVALATTLSGTILAGSLDLPWSAVLHADFILAGTAKALAILAILLLAGPSSGGPSSGRWARLALLLLCGAVLAAALADSHAAARLDGKLAMFAASALHETGAALWLGGLPCFALALRRVANPPAAAAIGRRFSTLSATGVGMIVIGAAMIAVGFIGSVDGVYGTAYGAMAATKAVLLGLLLAIGLVNNLAVRRFAAGGPPIALVRRLVEVEMGLGVAVLMAAASITSLPPAVDLTTDRVSLAEIAQRMAPVVPRLASPGHASLAIPELQARLDSEWHQHMQAARPEAFTPGAGALPPRNAEDIAWSEYNHHWAGLIVLLVGLAALAERSGRAAWARHWPLLFLLLAGFLFLRSDPEVWPMGDIGFFASLRDPEVVQHRVFVLLTVGFAFFEWGVRTKRLRSQALALVFPLLTAIGGTLLLAHSHAVSNVKDQLLIELTHLPLAVLGVTAGWARWLQVKAPEREGRWAGWVWPVCFVLIALLLLFYREA